MNPQEAGFRQIIENHFFRYPLMQVEDLYKLIYQASFGGEHAVLDEELAHSKLVKEVAELGGVIREPEIEDLSPYGKIVRVNLRPYFLSGGNIDRLFEAFVKTSKEFHGDECKFEQYADWAKLMAYSKLINVPHLDIARFFEERRRKGYPSIHHSSTYKKTYHPAYRVIARVYLGR